MADRTGIQWTDATWNPIVGCSLTSPGCTNCYAMRMAARIEAMQPGSHYAGTTMPGKVGPVWTGKMALAPDHILTQPLRWRRPRTIFVNSMGDLFHEDVPDEWIDRVFAVMAMCPRHEFQVLTKRSDRMRAYVSEVRETWCKSGPPTPGSDRIYEAALAVTGEEWLPGTPSQWPLHNVWLGVSAEDQRRADERIPDLLATPAAIRFVSCEPLLGPIRLDRIEAWADKFDDCGGHPDPHWPLDTHDWTWLNALEGRYEAEARSPAGERLGDVDVGLLWDGGKLDLVIVGGENGPRPMHPDWARSLRDQCAATGTAFFFKQWGSWEPAVDRERADPDWRLDYRHKFGDAGATKWLNLAGGCGFHGERFHVMRRAGKARAGRLLDGREHNDLPRRISA
ncbi:phage Gp37/Gp68 family protein [Xanthobacter oligotrophicus]|uniref:Phage Gp37/Gp68 family protein n=1 Tax=Xanthobacter oligotrophicus TaxID=2607286 RepID=A0ABW6ZSB5_9HYPH